MFRIPRFAHTARAGTLAAIAIAANLAACTDSTGPRDRPDVLAEAIQPAVLPHHEGEHMSLTATLRPPTDRPRYPDARGRSEWTREDMHREMHFSVRYLPAGLRVIFYVGGTRIGTTRTVDRYGRVTLHVDSQHDQYVPSDCRGKLVVVKTTGGILAVQGRFPY
jgi:hypothetical protein